MKRLIFIGLLFCSSALASDYSPIKDYRSYEKLPDDYNVQISGKTYNHLMALRDFVCKDVAPVVYQRFDNTGYKEACE